MLAVLLAVVRLTLPSFEADLTHCAAGAAPLRDLATVRLIGWTIGGRSFDTLAVADVRGREGDTLSLAFADRDSAWVVYAEAVDLAGNVSCASRLLSIGPWPLDVQRREGGFMLAPNPTRDAFTLVFPSEPGRFRLRVWDVGGRERLSYAREHLEPGRQVIRIRTLGWEPGVYLVRIEFAGKSANGRIVIYR